jgi:hypothetical protein
MCRVRRVEMLEEEKLELLKRIQQQQENLMVVTQV